MSTESKYPGLYRAMQAMNERIERGADTDRRVFIACGGEFDEDNEMPLDFLDEGEELSYRDNNGFLEPQIPSYSIGWDYVSVVMEGMRQRGISFLVGPDDEDPSYWAVSFDLSGSGRIALTVKNISLPLAVSHAAIVVGEFKGWTE